MKFRLQDTCIEASKFFEGENLKTNPVKFASAKIMLEYNTWEIMRSVLNDPSKVGGLEMAVNEQSVGGIVVAEIPN